LFAYATIPRTVGIPTPATTMFPRALVLALLALVPAHGFAPSFAPSNRALRASPMRMASTDLVTVNDGNVKASLAIAGGATGLVLGGPIVAGLAAVLANYVANKENEVGETTMAAGKTLLMLYNLALKTNADLEITDKISASITKSIESAKSGESGETVEKIQEALDAVVAKATEMDDEYAIVEALKDLLVKAGDLSIEAIDGAFKFADENDLASKAAAAASEATEKAKAVADKGKETAEA